MKSTLEKMKIQNGTQTPLLDNNNNNNLLYSELNQTNDNETIRKQMEIEKQRYTRIYKNIQEYTRIYIMLLLLLLLLDSKDCVLN